MICTYHWRRQQREVPATRSVAGELMCENCFKGRECIPTWPVREPVLVKINKRTHETRRMESFESFAKSRLQ